MRVAKLWRGFPYSECDFIHHEIGERVQNVEADAAMPKRIVCCEVLARVPESQRCQPLVCTQMGQFHLKDASPNLLHHTTIQIMLNAIMFAAASENATCLLLLQSLQHGREECRNDTLRASFNSTSHNLTTHGPQSFLHPSPSRWRQGAIEPSTWKRTHQHQKSSRRLAKVPGTLIL